MSSGFDLCLDQNLLSMKLTWIVIISEEVILVSYLETKQLFLINTIYILKYTWISLQPSK